VSGLKKYPAEIFPIECYDLRTTTFPHLEHDNSRRQRKRRCVAFFLKRQDVTAQGQGSAHAATVG
jgi:hypothetical protein